MSDAEGTVPRFASHPIDGSYQIYLMGDASAVIPSPYLTERVNGVMRARRASLDPIIDQAATRHGVDPALVRAVIEVESQFAIDARSPKGALGVMQLMAPTAKRFGVGDRRDPSQNIEGGVAYLRHLLARFHGNVALALAAYNAGEGAVDRHGRVIPRYRETMLYVPKVLEAYARYRVAEDGVAR